jgi:hypothetical protein
MKKQLLNLGFVAAALALYVFANAAPIEPVRTLDVPEIAAVTLDGAADDGYSDSQDTDWGYPDQQEGYGGESDFKADYQIAWDADNLYVLGIFSDDVEHDYTWEYSSEWMFDNCEFFIQLDTNTVTTSYDDHTIQLRVCRGLDSVQTAGRAARSDWGYYMEAQAAGGWITEVAIPWTAVLAEGEGPELSSDYFNTVAIGWDFAGADSDNSDGDETVGNRDYQTFWDLDGQDGTEDLAWNNTATFGYIHLMEVEGVENHTANTINAYPNPATNSITFDVEGQVSIEIFSITGVRVMTATTKTVDLTGLNSGVYVARIGNEAINFTVK